MKTSKNDLEDRLIKFLTILRLGIQQCISDSDNKLIQDLDIICAWQIIEILGLLVEKNEESHILMESQRA